MSELHAHINDLLQEGLSYHRIAEEVVQDFGIPFPDAYKWVRQVARETVVYDDESYEGMDKDDGLD